MIRAALRFAGWLVTLAIATLFLWSCLLLAYIGGPPQ